MAWNGYVCEEKQRKNTLWVLSFPDVKGGGGAKGLALLWAVPACDHWVRETIQFSGMVTITATFLHSLKQT